MNSDCIYLVDLVQPDVAAVAFLLLEEGQRTDNAVQKMEDVLFAEALLGSNFVVLPQSLLRVIEVYGDSQVGEYIVEELLHVDAFSRGGKNTRLYGER